MDPYLTPHTKINSKWIKEIHVRPKPIKLPEENTGENLHDIGCGNDFLTMTPKAQAAKAKRDNWNYIKLKNFHRSKNS